MSFARARLWQQAFLAEYKHNEADHDHDGHGDNDCDGGPSCLSFDGVLSSVGVTSHQYLTKAPLSSPIKAQANSIRPLQRSCMRTPSVDSEPVYGPDAICHLGTRSVGDRQSGIGFLSAHSVSLSRFVLAPCDKPLRRLLQFLQQVV